MVYTVLDVSNDQEPGESVVPVTMMLSVRMTVGFVQRTAASPIDLNAYAL